MNGKFAGFTAVLLLLLSGFPILGAAPPEVGHIQVQCEPGVQIFLGELLQGVTAADVGGLIIQDVPAGRHTLRAVKPGFRPQETAVTVAPGQVLLHRISSFVPAPKIEESGDQSSGQIVAAVGTIIIQSLPVQCEFTIRGEGLNEKRSKTQDRITISNLAAGTYDVTFTALGKTLRDRVVLEGGETVHLMANFIDETVRDLNEARTAERLETALGEARAAEEEGDWSGLAAAAHRALSFVPDQREALEFRDRALEHLQPEIDALLVRARELELAERWEEAAAAAEQSLRIAATDLPSARELLNRIRPRLGPQPGQEITLDLGGGVKLEMVRIGPGNFMMGSPSGEANRRNDEGPQHRVEISRGFWMGKYPVTQDQYQRVMGSNPSQFKGGNLPVECVSRNDAKSFCEKLNQNRPSDTPENYVFRLPTEAEWEYACRAGTTTAYYFGDDSDRLGEYAWFFNNSGRRTQPVGSKKPNDWGLFDMHGNVWEWCEDSKRSYTSSAQTDPVGVGSSRVLRGGSCNSPPRNCRSANRYYGNPRNFSIGFRVVLAGR